MFWNLSKINLRTKYCSHLTVYMLIFLIICKFNKSQNRLQKRQPVPHENHQAWGNNYLQLFNYFFRQLFFFLEWSGTYAKRINKIWSKKESSIFSSRKNSWPRNMEYKFYTTEKKNMVNYICIMKYSQELCIEWSIETLINCPLWAEYMSPINSNKSISTPHRKVQSTLIKS